MSKWKNGELHPEDCEICKDGWPVLENEEGDRLHDLPEPAGMFVCRFDKNQNKRS